MLFPVISQQSFATHSINKNRCRDWGVTSVVLCILPSIYLVCVHPYILLHFGKCFSYLFVCFPSVRPSTLKLGSKGSGDSVLVLMHVTYLSHLLCTYIQLSSTLLHAQASPPDYCSGLGSAPPATAHAQNVLHSETKSKVRPPKEFVRTGAIPT